MVAAVAAGREQGPPTPPPSQTGVLVPRNPKKESISPLARVASWTPRMYGLSTPLDELVIMAFPLSQRGLIFRRFQFFYKKIFFWGSSRALNVARILNTAE